jgi:PGF-pre-PGF domain-containing protein/PGF-CTERM protein
VPACKNLVQDVVVHGGVAWNEVPQSRDDVLFVLGASSLHQDNPQKLVEGRYRIVGEVVSTKRIDEDLPDGAVLIIYELDRQGSIDYDSVNEETKSIIENRTGQLIERFRADVDSSKASQAENQIPKVTPEEPATVRFDSSSGNSGIDQLSIQTKEAAEDVTVTVTTVTEPPEDAPELPDRAVRTMDISVGIGDDSIEGATFDVTITKDVDYDGGELAVYRYHDGSWNELEATVKSETETELTLSVETPGFSYFAVREKAPEEDVTVESSQSGESSDTQSDATDSTQESESPASEEASVTETSTPGFSIPVAVLGVLLSALLIIRRQQ